MSYDFKRFTGKVVWVDTSRKTKNIRATVPPVYQANTPEDIPYLPILAPRCPINKTMQIGDTVNVYIMVNPNKDYDPSIYAINYEQERLIKEVGFYEPSPELSDNAQKFMVDNAENDPEIMMLHENAGQIDAQLYDAAHGFVTKAGETMMQISPDGNWGVQSGSTKIAAEGNTVVIGDNTPDATSHPVVLGDKLKDILNDVSKCLNEAAVELNGLYRPDLGSIFQKCSTNIAMALSELTTDQVKINKSI